MNEYRGFLPSRADHFQDKMHIAALEEQLAKSKELADALVEALRGHCAYCVEGRKFDEGGWHRINGRNVLCMLHAADRALIARYEEA